MLKMQKNPNFLLHLVCKGSLNGKKKKAQKGIVSKSILVYFCLLVFKFNTADQTDRRPIIVIILKHFKKELKQQHLALQLLALQHGKTQLLVAFSEGHFKPFLPIRGLTVMRTQHRGERTPPDPMIHLPLTHAFCELCLDVH